MNSFWRKFITPLVLSRPLQHSLASKSTYATFCKNYSMITPALLKFSEFPSTLALRRNKSKKAQVDSDDEDQVFTDDSSLSKDSKVVKFSTTSMRTDAILKSGLGVARNPIVISPRLTSECSDWEKYQDNFEEEEKKEYRPFKIETMFYESRIRVNGKKILKKSAPIRQGDEIDVIKTVSPKNADHLYVSRVEVISVAAKEESISVTARRFKTLLIENYDEDPYKASSSNNDN